MTDLEVVEQQLLDLRTNVEDLVDDARTAFEQAFKDGYEKMEGHMDKGFTRLDEIVALL